MNAEVLESGLVTVIMPFLNTRERFLSEAIESVRDQTYENWELILVNDGSAPEISAFAAQIAKSDPTRIHYLTHQQGGVQGSSRSRNLGLSRAQGEYVAFLDSDDVWKPAKLEEQLRLFATYPDAGMIYGNTLYWYSWTGRPGDRRRDNKPHLGVGSASVVAPPKMLKYSLQGRIAVPCMCSVIMRRDVLSPDDWFEDEFDGMYDDQVLYAKFWASAPVCVVDRCWDQYRQHPDSMTAQSGRSMRHYRSRQHYLEWLTRYLERNAVQDPGLWRALTYEKTIARSRRFGSMFRKLRSLAWRVLPSIK